MRVRKATVLALAAAASVALLGPRNATASMSVEMGIYERINAERAEALTVHSGLAAAARDHSRRMAAEGSLSHEGADARVNNAPPDPVEPDGAPDNGFPVAAWCENVTYTSIARSESEAAQQLFDQWNRGGAHHRCMMDTTRNVGGVGVYYDGKSYWATFIAEVDDTPPGGGTRSKPKPAETPPTPEARPAPAATTAPESEADDQDEQARDEDVAAPPGSSPTTVVGASAAPSSEPESRATAEPSRARQAEKQDADTVDRPVPADDAPFAGAVHRATAPSDPPLAIGWQEVLGVAGVLSVASYLLRKRWVLVPA